MIVTGKERLVRGKIGLMSQPVKRFKLITSSYLFLIKGNKILLSRRFNTGYEDGKYSLPAGHLDKGETIENCLIREAKEEIGITLKKKDIKLVHVMHRQEKDIRLDFFYTASKYTGKITNAEPEKCDELQWFELDKLPGNTVSYIKQAIEMYLQKTLYSEIGF